MKKLHFAIDIKATKERVWSVLWSDKTYSQWTSSFSPSSRAVTDWKEGSDVMFVDDNDDGMKSRIAKSVPNEYMAFEAIGEVKGGKETIPNAENQKWAGAMEEYTLRETGNITQLEVNVDVAPEYEDEFKQSFPKALNTVKEIAEK